MATIINEIDILNEAILNRSFLVDGVVRSIRVNSLNSTSLITYPLVNNGTIKRYPQNPLNTSYTTTTIKTIENYGDINFPLDAIFNPYRQRMWIADAGNQKVLVINSSDYSFIRSVDNMILPHALVLNSNNRNVFIKSYVNTTTQKITEVTSTGAVVMEFNFPGVISSTTISYTNKYLNLIPRQDTIDFDNNLQRLWFISGSVLYMIDLETKQIIPNDLESERLYKLSSLSIDSDSGNAFVVISDGVNWYVQQIYKDNNEVLGTAYLEVQPIPY